MAFVCMPFSLACVRGDRVLMVLAQDELRISGGLGHAAARIWAFLL
jgi:hypothetical protein